ncbi:MAG: ABC transporter ATP-binding protein [Ignavibacteria bacterium]|nr:ABC transporter ATP-binding protein [Ignavibacteria bacterium]MBI3766590.1 ABC transporter ATP-binding protein [Ignavibacteriales bacterium]
MPDVAIGVVDLTKKFGTFTAVDHISFSVNRGEIFGFLGANGAGKSTTIRMLCGLLEPTTGTGTVSGFDINTQTELVKRNIGYMSQRFSLYEDLTVEENIRFFGGVYGLSNGNIKERMQWVTEMAGLRGREKSLTKTLAGGWKQRLALGCAILHEPKILFLDEPTSGVDPVSRRKFWELINQLSEQGVTILVTTHYLDEAEYCNDIILINAGRLIASGSPKELKLEHITYPILEVETPDVVNAMDQLKNQPWVIEISLFGTYLHVGVQEEEICRASITSILEAHQIPITRIERIVPSLEDVFLHLLEEDRKARAA